MNANNLKFFMMGLMVLDHLSFFISDTAAVGFHVLTRCVGVFFAYMVVEGFFHTRSKSAYFFRLAGAAAVMFVGNSLLNLWLAVPLIQVHNNIFLTLTAGLTLLLIVDWSRNTSGIPAKAVGIIGAVAILAAGGLLTEGGLVLLPFMLITYFTKDRVLLRDGGYLLFSLLLLSTSFQWLGSWPETLTMLGINSDFAFITVLPILHLYNGERGRRTLLSKYIFYVFYPVHLWLIAILSKLFLTGELF